MQFILINALGIENSGGLTILRNNIRELNIENKKTYFVLVNKGKYINNLINELQNQENIKFLTISNYGNLYRLLFENIFIPFFVRKRNISLIYNLSGSNQFFSSVPNIVKIQNLLFYTKSLDQYYFDNHLYALWLKHIFLKRIVFLMMLKVSKNIEIQSIHVKDELSQFISLKNKKFFLKNDFHIHDKVASPKNYETKDEITFLYVVGPHFNMPHKNIKDFIGAMLLLLEKDFEFKINITLTRSDLEKTELWDQRLNNVTNFLGYIDDKKTMKSLYHDNVVLISTSIIETLGLHVIEASLNGILCIVPNESYALKVYGEKVFTYNLFNSQSLLENILGLKVYNKYDLNKIILDTQSYIYKCEIDKYKTSNEVLNEVLRQEG